MKKDKEKTIVVFRVFTKDFKGDVVALFPVLPGTNDPNTCLAYEHIGQHSTADYAYVVGKLSRPALPCEYRDLKRELENVGYNLDIRRRSPSYGQIDLERNRK